MKKKYFLFVLFVSILAIPININGQTLVDNLSNFMKSRPQEKAYLHLDKPFYVAGDNIWFKSYLVEAMMHLPASISSVLHVELIGPSLEVIQKLDVRIIYGGAAGDFTLADTLSSGNYMIRAYTDWMRNFSDDFFYKKTFPVVSITDINQEKSDLRIVENKLDLFFFPEGGDLIDGLTSKVAFKAIGPDGLSRPAKGTILDSSGNTVTTFETTRYGIGVFLLQPKIGESYKAIVSSTNQIFDLPQIKSEGCAMNVIHSFSSDKIIIGIQSKGVDLRNGHMVIHQRGKVVLWSVLDKKESFAVSISRDVLGSGISHITFFDSLNVPLVERLFFTAGIDNQTPSISLSKDSFDRREEVNISIDVRDLSGARIEANLSLSISPSEQVKQPINQENIKNYLILSSDLRGYIEEPNYYFDQTMESYKAADILMLTQGWRRFIWKEVMKDSTSGIRYLPNQGNLMISGRIVDLYSRKPVVGTISMTAMDNATQFSEAKTDAEGRFVLYGTEVKDSTSLVLKATRTIGKKGKTSDDVLIILDSQDSPLIDSENSLNREISVNSFRNLVEQQIKIEAIDKSFNLDLDPIILDEFIVTSEKNDQRVLNLSRGIIYPTPNNRLILDEIPGSVGFLSIFQILARVAGVQVVGTFPTQDVVIRGLTSINLTSNPLYMVDGIPVDAQTVNLINPRDVEFVDVLKGTETTMYGARGAAGVVLVYTRRGKSASGEQSNGMMSYVYPGYSKTREFYSPNYSVRSEFDSRPDFRSTLYWDPSILLKGEATPLQFYTSDQKGEFDIILQGITANGQPIFLHKTMVVK